MSHILLIVGRDGVLVPDPDLAGRNPPRFLGKRRMGNVKANASLIDCYESIEEPVQDSGFVRDAVLRGDLIAADDETAELCGLTVQE
jgi:hypothetical protein